MSTRPRARIGVLVPTGNVVHEREFASLGFDGAAFRFATFAYPSWAAAEFCADALMAMTPAARGLVDWGADAILVGCTAASMVCDRMGLGAALERAIGRPVITAGEAALQAIAALELRTVAVATPYGPVNNAIVLDFLESSGVEVVAVESVGPTPAPEDYAGAAAMSAADVLALARLADREGAQAVYLPCTAMPSLEAIDRFERWTGKPAFSSVQAGYWASLHRLGLDGRRPGAGRLLETWDFRGATRPA